MCICGTSLTGIVGDDWVWESPVRLRHERKKGRYVIVLIESDRDPSLCLLPGVITISTPFSLKRCPCLDDKVHSHPTN